MRAFDTRKCAAAPEMRREVTERSDSLVVVAVQYFSWWLTLTKGGNDILEFRMLENERCETQALSYEAVSQRTCSCRVLLDDLACIVSEIVHGLAPRSMRPQIHVVAASGKE
jgi:hypothetical protein